MQFQVALNKTFCPTPPPLIHRRLKHCKKQKLTKQCFAFPHRFSTQSLQYQNWKANKYSFLKVIELRPPVSKSSAGSQNFMLPTDFDHKYHKTGIKNWLPIGFNFFSMVENGGLKDFFVTCIFLRIITFFIKIYMWHGILGISFTGSKYNETWKTI